MTIRFAVLGDSIAYGQGASRPADTAYARLAADLAEAGRPATVRVFAVPGSTSQALAGQAAQAVAWTAGLALIIIGANDLTRLIPPVRAADQLAQAVRALRAAGAEVVVAPAPDLSVVPWVPAQMRLIVQAGSQAMRQAQATAALSAGARVADISATSSASFATDRTLFSADNFHPSSAGYAVIADALKPAIRQAAGL